MPVNKPIDRLDLAVIGAGPCGLATGIAAKKAGLSCSLFDQSYVASSIGHYPTFMTFFSTAERLEIGDVPFIVAGDKPTRREALRYYQRLADHFDLDVRQYHKVESVSGTKGDFAICARSLAGSLTQHFARNVVFSTGYFDHPNRLDVPGAQLAKVRYGYDQGHEFFRQNVLIVGGGNSAVDAALELYRWKARVTLVHFAADLDAGVKPWVLPDILGRIKAGEIRAVFKARVAEIRPNAVRLRDEHTHDTFELPNDWVLAMTGFRPRPSLLESLGVFVDPLSGKPAHDPISMQTNVPGVFIAGVLAAGHDANKVFIENGRDHGARIVMHVMHEPS
jgi:thioredoxin reductase (NADPH)